ncbi:hypothetical protein C7N43_22025 [Sphingobacteriales bacterium UPWRP_1]|nr:hypothetical protein B6N25_07165 [Sphingobacteriales bacterium TSM_CSS]PSJ74855.1 hypothetical protein C7N43_22025 [Sphingobacteriales bacterium UPWRP_1]
MELVFNELSFLPHSNNEFVLAEMFIDMLQLYAKIQNQFGYEHLIFPSNIGETKVTTEKTFAQWVYSISNQGLKNKILSVPFKRPFANDILEEKAKELHKYYYTNEEAGINEEYCIGLPTAYLKEKVAISLATHKCWVTSEIVFKEIINDDLETKDILVYNISNEDHLAEDNIKDELMYSGKLDLKKRSKTPTDDDITLSGDHHGNKELKAFAKKIFKNEYVECVINNIDFSPKAINFIKNIYPDGKIELVLYWESAGYGMVIQTTGRNYRETEAIAKILKEEFDK